MKSINSFIYEGQFSKLYKKNKLTNTKELEDKLISQLNNKDIICEIKFDSNIVNLNLLDNSKEGVVGHIIESVLCQSLSNLNIEYDIKNAKEQHGDILINNELWEIKAFNKEIKNGKIQHGISFTTYQIENEGNPVIFIQYKINDNKINIKNIYCRYPDEITYSKGNKTNRGTVVSFKNIK